MRTGAGYTNSLFRVPTFYLIATPDARCSAISASYIASSSEEAIPRAVLPICQPGTALNSPEVCLARRAGSDGTLPWVYHKPVTGNATVAVGLHPLVGFQSSRIHPPSGRDETLLIGDT
jgi:hypothetical protein